MRIRHATVLGAGVMGSQIAAHLANAGLPVALLDVTRAAADAGLARLRTLSPAPLFVPEAAALIHTGSFDDLARDTAHTDWIIEAVVEQLDVKRALVERIDAVRPPAAIVSSNTSGIPLSAIVEGRSSSFARHWLGTHFFNPPRYLRLVELIPTAETDPAVTAVVAAFIEQHLGKAVVPAPDTPGFIANHLGVFGIVRVFDALATGRWTVEDVDAITGPIIGRPKSATLRTVDLAGLDVLAHVADDLARRLPPDQARQFALPAFVRTMVERQLIGDKTGAGFYKKVKGAGGTQILTLDLETFEYRDARPAGMPSLAAAKSLDTTPDRLRLLMNAADAAGDFLRATFTPTLDYARTHAPFADAPAATDRAMREGFGWEIGPFDTLRVLAGDTPAAATPLARRPIVQRNDSASLRDLGDGVLCVEFHSKMNTIGGDTIAMLHEGLALASRQFQAMVIANDAVNFSAGANLMLVLMAAENEDWDEIDAMVRAFQGVTQAIRYADVPVVVAPAGLTLGGGCEIALHADRVQAAAETYMGLVEVGVGLIPAGGGTTAMLRRAASVQSAFETIGFGKVSTSGADARKIGYLRAEDDVTMNREALIDAAKAVALARVRAGYVPPPRAPLAVGGPDAYATLALGVHLMLRAGRISEHDARIGRAIARVLSGGDVPYATMVSEQQVLDLEREAFLGLCGEPPTQDRIAAMLRTGKALRN